MTTPRTTAILACLVVALTAAAVGAFAAGFAPVGVIALATAVALAVGERNRLVRSMRPASQEHRRRIFLWATALGACAAASLAVGLIDLGDRD